MELISNLFVPFFTALLLLLLLCVGQIRTAAATQESKSTTQALANAKDSEDCSFEDRWYSSGDTWVHHEDCTRCSCRNGLSFCTPVPCDYPKGCRRVIKPQPRPATNVTSSSTSCCPTCADCVSKTGHWYVEGEVWDDDSCTTCVCAQGRKRCHTISCKTNCLKPRFIPGECCPVCDADDVSSWSCPSTLNCGQVACEHGMKLDSNGCPSCECNKCASLANCTKTCASGFSFNEDGCAICECIDNDRPSHRHARCSHSYSHSSGDEWFDGCRHCVCRRGVELCSVLSCPSPAAGCERPKLYPGECCPRCGGDEPKFNVTPNVLSCASLGRVHSESEAETATTTSWRAGPCLNCTCHKGRMLCVWPDCPSPVPASSCRAQTVLKDGECCATCPENKQREITRQPPSSSDFSCLAEDTRTIYKSGELWKVGECQTCICVGGQIECYSTQKCPMDTETANCGNPAFVKGQCCPICLDLLLMGGRNDSSSNDYDADAHGASSNSNSSRGFWEPHCIILTVTLLVLAIAAALYIVRYRLKRKHRRRQVLKAAIAGRPPQDALLPPLTPPVTPNYDCCYKYYSSHDHDHLSEQKTPLCSSPPNAHSSSPSPHNLTPYEGSTEGSTTSTFVEKV